MSNAPPEAPAPVTTYRNTVAIHEGGVQAACTCGSTLFRRTGPLRFTCTKCGEDYKGASR